MSVLVNRVDGHRDRLMAGHHRQELASLEIVDEDEARREENALSAQSCRFQRFRAWRHVLRGSPRR